jgi:beta-glucanase (GH16 family)
MIPGGQDGAYTSGMISSQPGFAFTYGYVEARIQHPYASGSPVAGSWPAFWMITRDAAYPPEIDIDEWNPPGNNDQVHNGYRNTAASWSSNYFSSDSAYHVYGMRLDPSHVTFFYDGVQTYQAAYDGDPYAWIIYFNLAVASGESAGATGYPASLNVSYCRAWVPQGVPAQPAITSISPASGVPSSGSVAVSFGAVSGATSYRVTPSPVDAAADSVTPSHIAATGASSPVTVTGLTNGARYNFTVAAINATGYSPESLPVPSGLTGTAALTVTPVFASTKKASIKAALAILPVLKALASGGMSKGGGGYHHRRQR